jgi:hypothetical protein
MNKDKIIDIQNMNDLKITINENSLVPTTFGNTITGQIYWQFKKQFFPEENWDDLVSVLLGWWMPALIRLIRQETDFERFYYMDGPCWLDIKTVKNEFCVECYNEIFSKSPVIECRVNSRVMTRKLLLVSTRFVSACKSVFQKTTNQLQKNKKKLREKTTKEFLENIKDLQKNINFINEDCAKIKYLLQNPSGTILADS